MRCVYFKFSFSHDTLRTLLFELPWTQETRAACCASLLLQQAHWVKGGFFFRFSKWMMEGSSDSGPNFNWVPASGARDGILRAQVDRLIISQCFLRCICTRSQMDNCIRHCASHYYLIFFPRHLFVIIDITLAAGSDRSGVFRVWVSVLQFAAVAFLL